MSRPHPRAALEAALAAEMESSTAGLNALIADWHKFRDEWGARYPAIPPAGLLSMFCVALHDTPGNGSRHLAGMLCHALWRIDELTGETHPNG